MNVNKSHILVVDDEDEIRDLFIEGLEEGGYACHAASSGESALQILAAKPVDVALVDIIMPRMSGLTLFKRIQEHFPQVAVIFVTAMDDVEIAIGNVKGGAFDYLVKPVTVKRLIEAVEEALHGRNAAREAPHNKIDRAVGPELPIEGSDGDLYQHIRNGQPDRPSENLAVLDEAAKVRALSSISWASGSAETAAADAETVPDAGDADGVPSHSEEEVFEGNVTLIVEAEKGDHRPASFVNALRQDPRVRLFSADFMNRGGARVLLSLRRPVRLVDMLVRKSGVSEVSVLPPGDAIGMTGDATVKVMLEKSPFADQG